MYVAEHTLDATGSFLVCALHHHGAVQAILDAGRLPGAYWSKSGHLIAIPCAALDDSDFDPRPAGDDAIRACDCPLMAKVPDGPADCWPGYDLTT